MWWSLPKSRLWTSLCTGGVMEGGSGGMYGGIPSGMLGWGGGAWRGGMCGKWWLTRGPRPTSDGGYDLVEVSGGGIMPGW